MARAGRCISWEKWKERLSGHIETDYHVQLFSQQWFWLILDLKKCFFFTGWNGYWIAGPILISKCFSLYVSILHTNLIYISANDLLYKYTQNLKKRILSGICELITLINIEGKTSYLLDQNALVHVLCAKYVKESMSDPEDAV